MLTYFFVCVAVYVKTFCLDLCVVPRGVNPSESTHTHECFSSSQQTGAGVDG